MINFQIKHQLLLLQIYMALYPLIIISNIGIIRINSNQHSVSNLYRKQILQIIKRCDEIYRKKNKFEVNGIILIKTMDLGKYMDLKYKFKMNVKWPNNASIFSTLISSNMRSADVPKKQTILVNNGYVKMYPDIMHIKFRKPFFNIVPFGTISDVIKNHRGIFIESKSMLIKRQQCWCIEYLIANSRDGQKNIMYWYISKHNYHLIKIISVIILKNVRREMEYYGTLH